MGLRPRRTQSRAAPAEAPGLAARSAAVRLVGGVLDHGRRLEAADPSLPAPARAEAMRLADLALRRLGQIDGLLAQLVERPPRAPVPHVLRVMAVELLFAGAPAHAAVDLAVRQAKALKGGDRLAGLVNAVGRRIVREGGRLLPDDAARWNTPDWLARRLAEDWGAETARAIAAAHLAVPPHDLTPRNPADAGALAVELGARVLPSGTLRLQGRPQLTALPGFATGAWWAQDAAAALPVRLLGDVAGRRVLDLCAAPGGKTMQLAALGARVTALDVSEARMARLAENLARTGLSATTVVADARAWQPEAPFDAVVLDAPCSATGTIRRHPDLPWRSEGESLDDLLSLQADLLAAAWRMVRPGGSLVYAVCSLFRAEGEGQAAAFRGARADARPVPAPSGLPPELTEGGALRTRPDLWPGFGGLDGFYACRFDKG